MAWVAVGSAAVGLVGGAMSARSANSNSQRQADAATNAGNSQRQFDQNNALDVMVRQMRAMYGQQQGDAMLRQYLTHQQYDSLFSNGQNADRVHAYNERIAAIDNQLRTLPQFDSENSRSGSELQRQQLQTERARLLNERNSTTQSAGAWVRPTPGGPTPAGAQPFPGSGTSTPNVTDDGGFMGQMNRLIGQFDTESGGILNDYNADTGRLNDMGQQNLADLNGWGDQRNANITRDTGRAQRASSAAINAQMARSGLGGSSLAMQAQSGNARRLMEGAGNQRASLADQMRALTSGARNDNINRLMSRMGGRTTVQSNILSQSQQLRQQPLQAQMNMLTGGAFAPFAQRDTRAYFPGVTGNNNASTSLGAAMSGQAFGGGLSALMAQLGNSNQYSGSAGSSSTGFGANGSNMGSILNSQNYGTNLDRIG